MTNNRKPVKVLPAACVSGTAISSMGMAAPPPVESTAVPAPQPSQRVHPERVPVRGNTLPEFNSVSLSLRLLVPKCQRVCWFCICCSLSFFETIYKPVCLQHYWSGSCPQGFTPPGVLGKRSKGQTLTYGFEVEKHERKTKYLNDGCMWNLQEEVCSSDISEEVK